MARIRESVTRQSHPVGRAHLHIGRVFSQEKGVPAYSGLGLRCFSSPSQIYRVKGELVRALNTQVVSLISEDATATAVVKGCQHHLRVTAH